MAHKTLVVVESLNKEEWLKAGPCGENVEACESRGEFPYRVI